MPQVVLPNAKAIVLCDEVTWRAESQAADLQGVRTIIEAAVFPYRHRQLCVYLELTRHFGRSLGFVRVIKADSEQDVFASSTHAIPFHDPLVVAQVVFRIKDCPFPEPGLYWIQFYCDEMLI